MGQDAVTVGLSLSKVPKLGETAELTFNPVINYLTEYDFKIEERSTAKIQAWVEIYWTNTQGSYSEAKYAIPVPLEEVTVNGNLSWEGNPFESEIPEFRTTIQLPREGIWQIKGFVSGEPWEKPFEKTITVAVGEDTAAQKYTTDFNSSPLAYLDYFPYGKISGKRVPDEKFDPIILELDISKASRVGEEAILFCRLNSLLDAPDLSVELIVIRKREDSKVIIVPVEKLLVDDNLNWQCDLKKNEPVEFFVSIIFPEEGDWEIYAEGDYPTNERVGFADRIRMHVSDTRSYYGWADETLHGIASTNNSEIQEINEELLLQSLQAESDFY